MWCVLSQHSWLTQISHSLVHELTRYSNLPITRKYIMNLTAITEKYDTDEKCRDLIIKSGYNLSFFNQIDIPITKWFHSLAIIFETQLEVTPYQLAKDVDIHQNTAKEIIELIAHQANLSHQHKDYEDDLYLLEHDLLEDHEVSEKPKEEPAAVIGFLERHLVNLMYSKKGENEKDKVEFDPKNIITPDGNEPPSDHNLLPEETTPIQF